MNFLTILIPHKNQPEKLERLLKSIPSDIEVVVVDDLSDEHQYVKAQHVVKKASNKIKLIRNLTGENNAGVARNIALENSNSEWVIFADSDDEFIEDNFEILLRKIKETTSDIVIFNVEAVKELDQTKSERVDSYHELINNWPLNKSTIAYSWVVPWGKAIRRLPTIDKRNLRFASKIASNDIEFSIELASTTCKIDLLDSVIYRCYESDSSLTATIDPIKARDRLRASCNANKILFKNRVPIHYNYNYQFFRIAAPLLLKEKDLKTVKSFILNLFTATTANIFIKKNSSN